MCALSRCYRYSCGSDVSTGGGIGGHVPIIWCQWPLMNHKIRYIVKLSDAITLEGAHDMDGASPVGRRCYVICCSGR